MKRSPDLFLSEVAPMVPMWSCSRQHTGLSVQQENLLEIWQDAGGNWWIAHNGNTLGHYPANLFTMLNKASCWSSWYGEVYDPSPANWTWTDMGSGEFDTAGYGYASYVRNPIWRDLLSSPQPPLDAFSSGPFVPACYRRSALLMTPEDSWTRFFYLGGPGGGAPGCD